MGKERYGMKTNEIKNDSAIVVVGSANADLFFRTKKLPAPGETVLASALKRSYGGKGANQAVAIARLGGRAVMVCRVGSDEHGKGIIMNFQREGVETRYISSDADAPTGSAFVTVDEAGENTIVVYTGANGKLGGEDVQRVFEVVKTAAVCVAQMEIPLRTIEKLAEAAQACNVPFILNTAPAPQSDISHIIEKVEILCPNRREAELLSGIRIHDVSDAVRAGRKLAGKGAKNVVITLGSDGAVLVTKDTERHVPAPKVSVCDTTGAGDAFVGGLAFAFASGKDLEGSIKFANIVAAISITKDGTQTALPTLDEVEKFGR
jgi:ribokinase